MAEFPPPEHSRGRRQEALHLGPERKYLGAGRRLPGKRQLVVRSPLCLGSHASVHTLRSQRGVPFATRLSETSQVTTGGRKRFISAEQKQRLLVSESGLQLP